MGLHSRDNDLVVNVTKEKQLTNMRASGTDENIVLTPATKLTLEQALEFIDDDELVEVTPISIRIRKKALKEHERKKQLDRDRVIRQKNKGILSELFSMHASIEQIRCKRKFISSD